jgi:hypothetical protein
LSFFLYLCVHSSVGAKVSEKHTASIFIIEECDSTFHRNVWSYRRVYTATQAVRSSSSPLLTWACREHFSETLASAYESARRQNSQFHLHIRPLASCCRLCLQPTGTMEWSPPYILKLLTSYNTRCMKRCRSTEAGAAVDTLGYCFTAFCKCSELLHTDWISGPTHNESLRVK